MVWTPAHTHIQVTTHTKNNADTDTKNNYEEENYLERVNDDGDDTIAPPKNLYLGYVSRHVEASIITLKTIKRRKIMEREEMMMEMILLLHTRI